MSIIQLLTNFFTFNVASVFGVQTITFLKDIKKLGKWGMVDNGGIFSFYSIKWWFYV